MQHATGSYDDVNVKRDELQLMLDSYRDCRQQLRSVQKELIQKTDDTRNDCLRTISLCKRSQAAVVSELRKSVNSYALNAHRKLIHSCISEVGEKTLQAREDIKTYFHVKLRGMRSRLSGTHSKLQRLIAARSVTGKKVSA